MGIKKNALDRIVWKALKEGTRNVQVRGRLRKYMDKLWLEHKVANNVRIYNEHIFLFHDSTLITILHLPNQYKNYKPKS